MRTQKILEMIRDDGGVKPFARKIGISSTILFDIFVNKKKTNPTLNTLEKIRKGLGISSMKMGELVFENEKTT